MDNSQLMRCKVVTSGDIVELYFYQIPIQCGSERKREIVKNEENELGKRKDNIYRSRQNVRRIIWNNQTEFTKFVTLTYAETVLDVKKVRRDITTFVQSMRRSGYPMKYLYVLENQRERGLKENNEGCLHVHMVIFIDKFIKIEDLRRCWKHGFVGIEKIDNVINLGAYVCKYITKDNIADFGSHCYSCSIGLDRPVVERFYTLGYSDSYIDFVPEEVLNAVNVQYHKTLTHDFVDSNNELCNQSVHYFQGRWKDKNIFEERDPLNDFKRQIDSLGISQNE